MNFLPTCLLPFVLSIVFTVVVYSSDCSYSGCEEIREQQSIYILIGGLITSMILVPLFPYIIDKFVIGEQSLDDVKEKKN